MTICHVNLVQPIFLQFSSFTLLYRDGIVHRQGEEYLQVREKGQGASLLPNLKVLVAIWRQAVKLCSTKSSSS